MCFTVDLMVFIIKKRENLFKYRSLCVNYRQLSRYFQLFLVMDHQNDLVVVYKYAEL